MTVLAVGSLAVVSDLGPAFLTSLGALITSVALLLNVIPSLRRVEKNVNGKLDDLITRNKELRDQIDGLHTELSHKQRTIDTLIGKGGR